MRALVTLATEEMAELQQIALPSLESFAAAQDYELAIFEPTECQRPAGWLKVPALLTALTEYEEALWVDADVVITDPSEDVPIDADSWQAMAVHHTQDGEVPNCGVWRLRQPMTAVLEEAWTMTQYTHHGWWEQAAICELLGYNVGVAPIIFEGATELYKRTTFLSPDWNSHPWDEGEHPRFRHATMHPDRAAVMREWADA